MSPEPKVMEEAEGLRRAEKAIGEAGPKVGRSNDWVDERGVVVVRLEVRLG